MLWRATVATVNVASKVLHCSAGKRAAVTPPFGTPGSANGALGGSVFGEQLFFDDMGRFDCFELCRGSTVAMGFIVNFQLLQRGMGDWTQLAQVAL